MCENCEWQEVADEIDDMMTQEKYDFALDTLESIHDWITENKHVTPGQQEAVENIRRSKE